MEAILVIIITCALLGMYAALLWFLLIITDNRRIYLKKLNIGLLSILIQSSDSKEDEDSIAINIQKYYEAFVRENPSTKKYYPNLFAWLDSVLVKILCKHMCVSKIKGYYKEIEKARNELEKKYPYNKCTEMQQEILKDIQNVADENNKIVINNIGNRIEDEFIKMSVENKKNERNNRLSLIIGIVGIVFSSITFIS